MKKLIKIGSQFSGVGAFDQALKRLNIEYENIYQAEWDKFARKTYLENYEEPIYYVKDVHDTPTKEITEKYGSLDIAMFSPPCQSFSLAGKRLGKDDKRGILFFNSLEFIQSNKPRYFIFENVKGLLSDNGGKTFSEWVNLLGGKSVNGNTMMFPYDDAVPYHLYWQVLNAKEHGVPQNRERVFLVGIRDDNDNTFRFPIEEPLTKRLKDVLEDEVFEKYFLSETAIKGITNSNFDRKKNIVQKNEYCDTLLSRDYKDPKCIEVTNFQGNDISNAIRTGGKGTMTDKHNWDTIKIKSNLEKYYLSEKSLNHLVNHKERHDKKGTGFAVEFKDENSIATTLRANGALCPTDNHIKIKSATSKGYEEATEGDSINFSQPQSETRRGRVGKGVAQTLDTACNQGVMNEYKIRRLTPRECFRLMDFPDTFTWTVSDSQAYKQAGNSIVVNVLYKIFNNLLRNNSQYI